MADLRADRVAALYDVHGNLPALEAVLADVEHEGVDLVLVGGDVIWGPMPAKTLERLRSLGDRAVVIAGNCEREVVERSRSGDERRDAWTDWCADRMSPEQLVFVAALPATVAVEIRRLGTTLFCHGSPRSDAEMITARSSQKRLRTILADVGEDVVVCGHTHVQFDRRAAGKRIVNAGSVGMAYEGAPGLACWATLGPGVELRRTGFDATAAARAMRATGMPYAEDYVQMAVLEPPTADEATAAFERMARRAPSPGS